MHDKGSHQTSMNPGREWRLRTKEIKYSYLIVVETCYYEFY